jgi:hypothetical protein
MNQDFNNKMSALGNELTVFPSKVGMVCQFGGLGDFCKYIDQPGWLKTSSDAVRWDSSLLNYLWEVVKQVRFASWDKQGMSSDEWWQRQNYYYSQKIESRILMPTGQVVQKMHSGPSGQDSTTYDNTIMHTFVKFYNWRMQTGLKASSEAYNLCLQNYRFGLFGDDNAEAISPQFSRFYTLEQRIKAYAVFGIKLDVLKDVESLTLHGHQWLGKTIQIDQFGVYSGIVNPNKILCSLRNLESSTLEYEIRLSRALALMVECTFTPKLFSFVRGFAYYMIGLGIRVSDDMTDTAYGKWLLSVPTHADCLAFWLGHEPSL